MDIELIKLVNSFQNTIALNNLLIKEKIIRKLEMIHTMWGYGFPLMNFSQQTNNKIMQELRRIDKEGDIVKYSRAANNTLLTNALVLGNTLLTNALVLGNTDTNKILGNILHNAYQASGYNMILANAPIQGTTIEGDFIKLDCEAIYDTLTRYAPIDAVITVCQISADTYLIKIDSKENAIELCNLLNEKLLEGRLIKVEYIEPLCNQIELVRNNVKSVIGDYIDDIYSVDPSNPSNPSKLDDIQKSYLAWVLDIIYRVLQRIKNIRHILK